MSQKFLLPLQHTAVLVVDMQDKLLHVMHRWPDVLAATVRLLKFARTLQVPILATEQYPAGLGPTNGEISRLLTGHPYAKVAFNCLAVPALATELAEREIDNVVLAGIEAHICIEQTALAALARGMNVHVAADAVGSRQLSNCENGLAKMRQAGVIISCSETILYEWLAGADHPAFKQLSALVR